MSTIELWTKIGMTKVYVWYWCLNGK